MRIVRPKPAVLLGLVSTLAFTAVSCGPPAYRGLEFTENAQSAGSTFIPAKVDIVLVEDDTGSMGQVYSQIKDQLNSFLQGLEGHGWDYHFAVSPLTHFRAVSQALASKYDGNWGSQWIPSFPGAPQFGPGTLSSATFRMPGDTFTGLSISTWTPTALEPGFATIKTFLQSGMGSSGFLRSDAMLVLVIVGNGQDTSGVSMCTRPDGFTGPCDLVGQPDGSLQASFNSYLSFFQTFKGSAQKIRMYSAVSPTYSSSCLGGGAYQGSRYINMAGALGGKSYDICNTSVSSVLADLSNTLTQTKLAFRKRYLMISKEPQVPTIQVTRHSGGMTYNVPQNASNGWTYQGYLNNVYLIDDPVLMNLASGYAIQLNGNARLYGDDYATVTYKPVGSQDVVGE